VEEILAVRRESVLVPLGPDDEEKVRSFPFGRHLKLKITQPRSVPHNAFFHVFVQEAYDIWPAGKKTKLRDWKHLRAWLLVKAGYCKHEEIDVGDASLEVINTIVTGLRKFHDDDDRYYWYHPIGTVLHMWRPLSLKFESIDEHDFVPLAEEIYRIIFENTGLDADERHKEWIAAHPHYAQKPKKSGR
jgi:hypothetical protein